MRLGPACLLLLSALGACAPTTGPSALPVEVLVVLDREERSLRLIATDSTNVVRTIDLAPTIGAAKPTIMAVRGTLAIIGLGTANGGVVAIDLATRRALRPVIPIKGVGDIAAIAISETGQGFTAVPASPNEENVTYFEPAIGASVGSRVEGGPQGFGVARGTVFLVMGNRQLCYPAVPSCLDSPSWLKPFPFNTTDSIALFGPGNASATALGSDGLLYVLSTGNGGFAEGRLSAVDLVSRKEVASFGGFGLSPRLMASDGGDHLLIAGPRELMVFNVRERRVEKGAGAGIPFIVAPRDLATDAFGRAYLPVGGSCVQGGTVGAVRVFGTDLVERNAIPTGVCPVAAAVTEIPAQYFRADP
ncbi:MAG: hypothetical protein ABJC19_01455 [Gemmatimonadota bacterium]